MSQTDFDAIVVGAGVIGSSVAYELAKSGRSVCVVDAAAGPGQGSTSASSAVVRFHYSTMPGVAASWEAKFCWEKWADHLGGTDEAGMAKFVRSGVVILEDEIINSERIRKLYDEVGIPYEVWDTATIAERVPGIELGYFTPPQPVDDPGFFEGEAPRPLAYALWNPDGGFIDDPSLAAVNLFNAAKRHGAVGRFKTKVTGVLKGDGKVQGVALEDGSQLRAPIVVNVAGPWSSQLNTLADVLGDFTVSTTPMRQEVHHLPGPPGFNTPELPGPILTDVGIGTYTRGTAGDGYLVGGTEPECDGFQWLESPDDANMNPTRELWEAQTIRAAKRLPTLTIPNAVSGVVGVYDVTEDWTPIYDKTSLEGFYVAIGTSGNQFKNAPVSGRFILAIIEAEAAGQDHDTTPVQYVGEHTGLTVDLGAFSRKRERNLESSNTVMG